MTAPLGPPTLLLAEVGACQLFLLEGDPFVYELFGGGPDARFTNLLAAAEELTRRTAIPQPGVLVRTLSPQANERRACELRECLGQRTQD